ncbi:serine hydrolase domain-containing protein [Alsobacter sp. KACC 23698]|uniref:Serine hydrolase domain-containing protein n=1 Tax=Alsobacter sp. KACC 23698 TaxID=3149229 RepID=A0AAU7JGS8_9HYPH
MNLDEIADRAFAPVRDAIAESRIPGAVFGVVDGSGAKALRWAGAAQVEPVREPMARDTIFDLASLTKVVFTTRRLLDFAAEGRIDLDAPLTTAIPDLRQYDVGGAPERRLTFRQCLAHQTHLPAVEPLYTYGQDSHTLRAFVLQRAWRAGPPVYSDINFILLGIAIERLTGAPLADQPVPEGFTFRPDPARCAATERCSWRGRVMRGEVHDENAFALGGASGHAGLFGTADALLDVAADMLARAAAGDPRDAPLWRREAPTRSLGWEMAHPGWSGSDACSPRTIGHTGFTGTGLWVDPDSRRAWTLLTNRVHPSRHRESGIVALRRAVGALVGESTVKPSPD